MNDTHILRNLTAFTSAAHEHQTLDRQYRAAWRYQHKREEIRQPRQKALNATERAYNQLRQSLIDLTEPTHLSRTARDIMEKWDNYRRNHAIMIAEYNSHNRQHTDTSRATFETTLKQTAEYLKQLLEP